MFSQIKKLNRGILLFAMLGLACMFYLLIMEAVDTRAKATITDLSYAFTVNVDKALVVSDPNLYYSYDNLQPVHEIRKFASVLTMESIDVAFSDKSALPENKDIYKSLFSTFDNIIYSQLTREEVITFSKSDVVKITSASVYKNTGRVTAEVLWEYETTDSDGNINNYAEWCDESFSFYKEDDEWYFESWTTNRGNSLISDSMNSYNYSSQY